MAYDIPVAILLVDHAAAAALVNEPADFFDEDANDRWDAVERLAQVTGAPISSFALEDGSVFHLGLRIKDDFCIRIDSQLLSDAVALRKQYPHPLIQASELAVVSQFC